MHRVFALWGFVSYSLLLGEDAMTTAGRLMLLYTLACVDSGFISKDASIAPKSMMYALPTISLLAALGILAPENAAAPLES